MNSTIAENGPLLFFVNSCIQIDQEITQLITRQQQMDADKDHVKTQINQIRSDFILANKQKATIAKSLEKKVILFSVWYM